MGKNRKERSDELEMLEVALDVTAEGQHLLGFDRESLEKKVAELGIGHTATIHPVDEAEPLDDVVRFVDFRKPATNK